MTGRKIPPWEQLLRMYPHQERGYTIEDFSIELAYTHGGYKPLPAGSGGIIVKLEPIMSPNVVGDAVSYLLKRNWLTNFNGRTKEVTRQSHTREGYHPCAAVWTLTDDGWAEVQRIRASDEKRWADAREMRGDN